MCHVSDASLQRAAVLVGAGHLYLRLLTVSMELPHFFFFVMQALSDKINELEKFKSDSSLKISELNSRHMTEITSEKEKAHQVKYTMSL